MYYGRPRWLIRACSCGSKFKRDWVRGRMFVIGVVDLQCSKLLKSMECVVYGTEHYKEPLKSFCPDITMIVQKAT